MQTKKIVGLILFFLLATMVVAAPVLSAVPDTINFQGMLTDDNGDPVADGSYIMRFYLFDAASGGNQLWNSPNGELQTVTVTNGVYNVQLGINESLDYTIFNGGTAWLEVVVEGETLSPRQPLTSTAYALKAGDADTIAGQTLGDLNTAYVNIGETDVVTSAMVAPDTLVAADLAANSVNASEISTGAVGTLEIANGSVTAADLAEDYVNVGGDSMTGGLVLPDNGLTVGTRQLVVNGGKIGLGTFLPDEQLHLTGNLRLPATTSTTGIIMSESSTLIHTYGYRNFFAGDGAGNLDMTGYNNTANGYTALHLNTTGNGNTASGAYSLQYNTTGYSNTASGAESLRFNFTGNNNTASGAYALYYNTSGSSNTANGFYALRSNSNGRNNTAIGTLALEDNTEGEYNTASGSNALHANITGYENTASGYRALYDNTTGYENTASGALALTNNTTGYENTASGYRALLDNTTGYENAASGYHALRYNTTGIHNAGFGTRAGDSSTTGNGNTFIGCDSDASADDLINATALGYSAVVNGSNRVRIGNTYVSQIGGNVGWSNLSDIRGKADIAEITLGLDFINSLRPVEFRLIDGNDGLDLGFIAQDIETLLGTGYNILGIGGDTDRTLSLRYTDFIAPMVKAIQEQQGIISELRSEIEALKEEMAVIRAKQ